MARSKDDTTSSKIGLLDNFVCKQDSLTTKPLEYKRLSPAKVTNAFDSYWRFAAERQRIFFSRMSSTIQPWSDDTILSSYKFTNAYRASDRTSQYLIRNVIYRDDLPSSNVEMFFRVMLFKLFNKIETWEILEKELGNVVYAEFSYKTYDRILSQARAKGDRIYSAAYIMPPGKVSFGQIAKHQNHLLLLVNMIEENVPDRMAQMTSMQDGFECLKSYPTIGDFLAYQFVTDLNYSELTDFNEMDFVVPGPGARDGIRKCFSDMGGLSEPEIIRLMADRQEEEFERLGLDFKSLWGRPLQLIDCQNIFCEVSKYTRVSHPEIDGISGRKRIKQKFKPNLKPVEHFYPPKWGLNDKLKQHHEPDKQSDL